MRRTHCESKREGVKDPANGYVTGQNGCVAVPQTAPETCSLSHRSVANDTVWDVGRAWCGSLLQRGRHQTQMEVSLDD
jgi:hypothetical protein